jgi:hypothetical protein
MNIESAERIQSFESLDGAARAVSHLVELKYDPASVAIAPRDFEETRTRRSLPGKMAAGLRTGAIAGAAVIGGVAVVAVTGVSDLVRSVLPAVAVATLVGAFVGVVTALIAYRRESAQTFGVPRSELRPTTFDVVVGREADDARHDLARWWDPAAPPVQLRRTT